MSPIPQMVGSNVIGSDEVNMMLKNIWTNIKHYSFKTWGYARLGWWKFVGFMHPGKESPEFQVKLQQARNDAKAKKELS